MTLVDSSAWTDFFSGGKSSEVVDDLLEANQAAVCGPVLTEILRGFRSNKERDRVFPLFQGCRWLPQPVHLWEEAGELGFLVRKEGRKVKTMDLVIGCYALAHQVPLFTLDSDFKKIKACGVPLLLV